jgi:hypothetical protein
MGFILMIQTVDFRVAIPDALSRFSVIMLSTGTFHKITHYGVKPKLTGIAM